VNDNALNTLTEAELTEVGGGTPTIFNDGATQPPPPGAA
jgi:hypothetical protein